MKRLPGVLRAVFRRGPVLFPVAGLALALYLLHAGSREHLLGSGWDRPDLLWGALALLALGGALWSWRRRRAARKAPAWEALLLGALAAGCAALALRPSPDGPAEKVRVVWTFEPPQRGAIISSPRVTAERVYVAAIRDAGLATSGAVYCLERDTRRVVWCFDDGGDMQHMYSSPCLAGGRLYVGEGMHGNFVCKLYCLDAASGRKRWHFLTGGHIESTPCVADGKVFFGAGDDGVYCLDAVTGRRRWQWNGGAHVDANPAWAGGRLFVGAGVSRRCKVPEVVCLRGRDGKVVWRRATDLPAWGSPAPDGARVYFGLGNGRLGASAAAPERPAGALLCVNADSGRTCWRYDVPDGVFAKPAAGGGRVYFGARDGWCYCLDRERGRLCWKKHLGSAVVTTPALCDGRLYVAASGGRVCCLAADSGRELWAFDVARHSQTKPRLFSSPAVVAEPGEGGGRRIYFGAELRNPLSSAAVLYCLRD
jgi:outer membrane protein assembly factor BamB